MSLGNGGLPRVAVGLALAGVCTLGAAGELRVSTEAWRYDVSGFVNDRGEVLDFERDLDVQSRPARHYGLALTGSRGWPDWVANFAQIGGRGERLAQEDLSFGPVTVVSGSSVIATRARFDDYDLTARWRWRRGAWQVMPGLSLKALKGEVVITDTSDGETSRQPYDELFPLLHLGAAWNPSPAIGLSALAQGVQYKDNQDLEWRLTAELGLFRPLYVQAGWQEKRYEIVLKDYRLDARLGGPIVGLMLQLPR